MIGSNVRDPRIQHKRAWLNSEAGRERYTAVGERPGEYHDAERLELVAEADIEYPNEVLGIEPEPEAPPARPEITIKLERDREGLKIIHGAYEVARFDHGTGLIVETMFASAIVQGADGVSYLLGMAAGCKLTELMPSLPELLVEDRAVEVSGTPEVVVDTAEVEKWLAKMKAAGVNNLGEEGSTPEELLAFKRRALATSGLRSAEADNKLDDGEETPTE